MSFDPAAKIWLTWRYETVNDKITKVPYQPNGRKASTTDPTTWVSYQEAKASTQKDGVGIVFEKSQGIIGIDLDDLYLSDCDLPLSFTEADLKAFLTRCNSYIEYSPSKKGLHILFKTKPNTTIELAKNKYYFPNDGEPSSTHIEIYTKGRYFTYTANTHALSAPLRTVTEEEFISLLSTVGYPWKKTTSLSSSISPSISSISSQQQLTDDEVLSKMFASKNGSKIKALYNGDTSAYSNDISTADAALCQHLAFWTQKNAAQINQLWLSSPLAQRKKTQEREDYRNRTIENAIDNCDNVYSPLPAQPQNDQTDYNFFTNKENVPELIWPNIKRIIQLNPILKDCFRLNEFSHFTECNLNKKKEWQHLNDAMISHTREFICENFPTFRKLSANMTAEAILRVAADNAINPPKEYLRSLIWDKTPRLNSWLHHTFGTPDDELHHAIGSNWLKGLVKRVVRPGCQFDEVLALESPQGWRKSTALRILGYPWHVETTHSIDSKDFYLLIAQNVIVEFSEGEVFDRSSVNKLKAEITKTEDQVRPPYERGVMKFPRSCVFAVTTNNLELKDDTGNRRWLPVTLEKVADIDWLKANKEQILAEAYHRVVVVGEPTHIYPESLSDLQASRGEFSDYDEKAIEWYSLLDEAVTDIEGVTLHAAIEAVFGKTENIQKIDEIRTASILRRSLHLDNKNKRLDGKVVRRWFPTAKTKKLIEQINSSTPTI